MNKETGTVRFLYKTAFGRLLLKLLTCPFVSKIGGAFLGSCLSRFMVKRFIRKNGIDMSEYEQRKYKSFNDFFTRRRTVRDFETDEEHVISPCDGHLSVYEIGENSVFDIKNAKYDTARLFNSAEIAERYRGGLCLIFRLTPLNYHRYSFACSGTLSEREKIKGKLHCVRPIAYTEFPVFCENAREVVYIDSDRFGRVAQMEVGALLVGRITNPPYSERAVQGEEKGYFEFGGSTIILAFEKDRLKLSDKFLKAVGTATEIPVRLGDEIGERAVSLVK